MALRTIPLDFMRSSNNKLRNVGPGLVGVFGESPVFGRT